MRPRDAATNLLQRGPHYWLLAVNWGFCCAPPPPSFHRQLDCPIDTFLCSRVNLSTFASSRSTFFLRPGVCPCFSGCGTQFGTSRRLFMSMPSLFFLAGDRLASTGDPGRCHSSSGELLQDGDSEKNATGLLIGTEAKFGLVWSLRKRPPLTNYAPMITSNAALISPMPASTDRLTLDSSEDQKFLSFFLLLADASGRNRVKKKAADIGRQRRPLSSFLGGHKTCYFFLLPSHVTSA